MFASFSESFRLLNSLSLQRVDCVGCRRGQRLASELAARMASTTAPGSGSGSGRHRSAADTGCDLKAELARRAEEVTALNRALHFRTLDYEHVLLEARAREAATRLNAAKVVNQLQVELAASQAALQAARLALEKFGGTQ